ncbi:hypothetical protein EDD17DRAFT_1621076 [Pisolithus thermaeus]|nr:hypothetical protein EV401DRAFT_1948759 [Pisolithus croceorrhizus]KAI6158670.1 hypothetical protein EDD17DRAFT_1621076 [Pisolithus thermaeus]
MRWCATRAAASARQLSYSIPFLLFHRLANADSGHLVDWYIVRWPFASGSSKPVRMTHGIASGNNIGSTDFDNFQDDRHRWRTVRRRNL